MKTIYIIGIGGRTGALFGRELSKAAKIIGVGLAREVEAINQGRIKIKRGLNLPEKFLPAAIFAGDFAAEFKKNPPDFVWLAVSNPVKEAAEFYYQNFAGQDKLPALILSQNGLSAISDARAGLCAALGQKAAAVEIIRVLMINGVDLVVQDGASIISYKLPVKLGFGSTAVSDSLAVKELALIFKSAGFKCQKFKEKEIPAMENSKLFTNLIGMAAAVEGMDVAAGWRNKEIFKKEIAGLKEFVLAVNKSGVGFVNNFCGYPIKFLAQIALRPVWQLLPLRGILAGMVARGRHRAKNLNEIDYYNGEVVRLGKKIGMATPANEEILNKAKNFLNKRF